MINMSSPTVQNIIHSTGYNPFVNGQYVQQPQQQQPRQNTYSSYADYNPYIANQNIKNKVDVLDNWTYSYDPMPNVVVNEARGIRTNMIQPVQQSGYGYQQQPYYNNGYNNNIYYNDMAFNGYVNPVLMRNTMESQRLAQKQEAINQGKIWNIIFKNVAREDETFDVEANTKYIESLYYPEPQEEKLTIKQKLIEDGNRTAARLYQWEKYCEANNIPMITPQDIRRDQMARYINHNKELANDCDMVDYFTRVYPELRFEELERELKDQRKNLKNRYDSKDFNKLIDKVSADKPDSYYAKIMNTFAETGVRLETENGAIITADQMEIKLPESILRKRKTGQDEYYEQRKKFYDSIFNKGSQL